MIEDDVEGTLVNYTDSLKKELDKRLIDYQKGKIEMITSKESKTRVAKLLKLLIPFGQVHFTISLKGTGAVSTAC